MIEYTPNKKRRQITVNKKTETKKSSYSGALLLAIMLILISTVTMRILSVVMAELSGDSASVPYRIVFAAVYVLDDVIFACGAGAVSYFVIRGEKREARLALFFSLLILALDFASSYLIALVLDYTDSSVFFLVNGALFNSIYVPGQIMLLSNTLVLLLNMALRALSYLMIMLLARFFLKNAREPETAAGLFALGHPVCRMAALSAIFRTVPYFVYEIYSTVFFLIRNISRINADNVINILLAYGEIIVDGIITYIAVYIVMTCMSLAKNRKKKKEQA